MHQARQAAKRATYQVIQARADRPQRLLSLQSVIRQTPTHHSQDLVAKKAKAPRAQLSMIPHHLMELIPRMPIRIKSKIKMTKNCTKLTQKKVKINR